MKNLTAYLEDGVYAEFDGFQIKLYTQQGQVIYLDDMTQTRLIKFMEKIHNIRIVAHPIIEKEGA